MTTFPPEPLPYQLSQLLLNQNSQLSYRGYEGTLFHLSGPQAPVLGAQDGAVVMEISGIDAPFRHLDNKGARQDGTSWYDTLYDPAEITFTAELSGMSPSDIRRVIGSWWGSWDPLKQGRLCWFSPERGEWWADVRMAKNVQTQFKEDWYQSGRVQFNWIARNDAAFWQSVDSVMEYAHDGNVVTDNFDRYDSSDLGPNWFQSYTGGGLCASPDGNTASWITGGGADASVINQYQGNGSESSNGHSGNDHQMISVTLGEGMPLPAVGVQVINSATGGTYILNFGSQYTTPLAYNASPATVQAALQSLGNIGSGNAQVSGSYGNYSITILNTAPGTGSIKANGSSLTGGTITVESPGSSIYVDFSEQGSSWYYGVHNTFGGHYTLSYGGFTTTSLPWNASAAAVQSALQALPNVGAGNATVLYAKDDTTFGTLHDYYYTVNFPVAVSTAGTLGYTSSLQGLGAYIDVRPYMPNGAANNLPSAINPPNPTWFTNHNGIGTGGGFANHNGGVVWLPNALNQSMVNIYQTPTTTSSQSVSMTVTGTMNSDFAGTGPLVSLQGLSDKNGLNYVFADVLSDKVAVGVVTQQSFTGLPIISYLHSEPVHYSGGGKYTLEIDGNNYNLLLNGNVICQAYDSGGYAKRSSDNSQYYSGFGANIPVLGSTTPGVMIQTWSVQDNFAHTFFDIWGRMSNDFDLQNGVRARFGYNWSSLSVLNSGTLTQVWSGPTSHPLTSGTTLSLQCGVTEPGVVHSLEDVFTGTDRYANQFQIYQNGNPLIAATGTGVIGSIVAGIEDFFGDSYGWQDAHGLSNIGLNYRGWGFGMTVAGTGNTQIAPGTVDTWSGGSDTGFITLSNMGDQPAWPRYLCYGPGSFVIGDVQSGNLINFGPLLPGQVALLTTLPRIQGVTDVTPSTNIVPSTVPVGTQALLAGIVNEVTNNNVPPLLEKFESTFGVLPPQGPMYSLLTGRFTTAIDPMLEQVGPTTVQIPCQIQGGNSQSKIIAAVTPMRRWPE